MSNQKVSIDDLADAIADGLKEYENAVTDDVKDAVKKAGKTVRDQIKSNAPVKTGKYASSWSIKNVKETANSLDLVVHSRNRYQIAHLLEHGHAKRNGGRTRAIEHIKPAEEAGVRQLEEDVKKAISNG